MKEAKKKKEGNCRSSFIFYFFLGTLALKFPNEIENKSYTILGAV